MIDLARALSPSRHDRIIFETAFLRAAYAPKPLLYFPVEHYWLVASAQEILRARAGNPPRWASDYASRS